MLPRSTSTDLLGLLALLGLGLPGTRAADEPCGPYPIAARLGNVTLSNGKVQRGVDLAIGEPPQHFAFMPYWHLNNTYLWGTKGNCLLGGEDKWTTDGCTTFRGGAYDPGRSTSGVEVFSASQYATDVGGVIPAATRYLEKVTLNDNGTSGALADFPLGVALNDYGGQGYYTMMGIGVGSNSSLLNSLRASGKIASRTLGFFTGRGIGAPRQADGSLVFGGYDRAKTNGRGYTEEFNTYVKTCTSEMSVVIADMQLNFPNGTLRSLFGPARSTMLNACLDPASPTIMRMPLTPYFNNWLSVIPTDAFKIDRGLGWWYFNEKFQPDMEPYKGDLTITLQSGLSVRIPNDLIVQPHTSINQQTGDIEANGTAPDWLIYSNQGEGAKDVPVLGLQFFAAAYLMVNLDKRQFTLWEAKQTPDTDLVAVDAGGTHMTSFCAVKANNDGGNNATGSPDPNTNNGNNGTTGGQQQGNAATGTSIGAGAIAGIAVGGVAALGLLIAAVVFFLLRRKRARQQAQDASAAAIAGVGPGGYDGSVAATGPGSAHPGAPAPTVSSMTMSPSSTGAPTGAFVAYPMYQYKPELDAASNMYHEMPVRGPGPEPGRFYELPSH